MPYLWFKWANWNQTKCGTSVGITFGSCAALCLVQIGPFEPKLHHFHQYFKDQKNHGIQHIFGSNTPIWTKLHEKHPLLLRWETVVTLVWFKLEYFNQSYFSFTKIKQIKNVTAYAISLVQMGQLEPNQMRYLRWEHVGEL